MSSDEEDNSTILTELAQLPITDALLFTLGLGLAYSAARSWFKFHSLSSTLTKIRSSPIVRISDLRSLLDDEKKNLPVFVRGVVQAKPDFDGIPNSLVCHESGEKGVVLERTQTCIYDKWRWLFGWSSGIRTNLGKTWKNQKRTLLRKVPFTLAESSQTPHSNYVIVNLDGSTHPIPLTKVHHHVEPFHASPYTFFQGIFGLAYPVGILDEHKILPLGQEISVVGICSSQDGNPQIQSCKDLLYFISDMTKDQMVVDLTHKQHFWLWGFILFASLSVGVLSYAIPRNWRRWKQWKQRRQLSESSDSVTSATEAQVEENEEVPDGALCVVCLRMRRRCVFVPCGHLVCCHRCALAVERDSTPQCLVCMQSITTTVRIYDS